MMGISVLIRRIALMIVAIFLACVIFGVLLVVDYVPAPVVALMDFSKVQGQRFYSFHVKALNGWMAGYSVYIYESPYYRIASEGEPNWKNCTHLYNMIEDVIRNNIGQSYVPKGPYKYIEVHEGTNYRAYIKSESTMIYFSMYEDSGGGVTPLESRKVCSDN